MFKHGQKFDFTLNGLVILTSNHPFSSSEASNALKRRVRQIETPLSVQEKAQTPMLYWCSIDDKWKGVLASELAV